MNFDQLLQGIKSASNKNEFAQSMPPRQSPATPALSNRGAVIKPARALINTAIKNSDIVAPYMSHATYTKGLLALNALYLALGLFDD